MSHILLLDNIMYKILQ